MGSLIVVNTGHHDICVEGFIKHLINEFLPQQSRSVLQVFFLLSTDLAPFKLLLEYHTANINKYETRAFFVYIFNKLNCETI